MEVRLVLLGADPFFADVDVLAPAAAGHLDLFADGPTDGASFQQVSNNVPGVTSPSFKDFPFFPNLFEFVVAEHNLLPRFPYSDATRGPSFLPRPTNNGPTGRTPSLAD
jgi:hypothetical protein